MPNNSYSSGVICPNAACKGKIFISLQDLLNKKSIQCPHCLLEWTLYSQQSGGRC